jgi:hypothetical protein
VPVIGLVMLSRKYPEECGAQQVIFAAAKLSQ